MGKLHEILAVEGEKKKTAEAILEETKVTFVKRQEHFTALRKEYQPDNEAERSIEQPVEVKPMIETVAGKLKYMADHQATFMDVVYQKELANCVAKADVILDGQTIAESVPATVLLGLESKLKALKEAYLMIPTLIPGEDWHYDPETGTYTNVDKKVRTKKVFKNHVKAPATEKHPAQVDTYAEDERIGLVVTTKVTSVLSPGRKSELLTRIDDLLAAVKTARQRANSVEVPFAKIGKTLFDYIHQGLEQRNA